jgi:rhodanese-related sulfurtransferase
VPGSVSIEWYDYPAKRQNANFMTQLAAKVAPDRPVAFLCRSGVRSNHAAALATANGYRAAFNILEGFEGDKNAQGQRVVNGWRVAGLPWRQD